MVPAPPRRWHCLLHNAIPAGHGRSALPAPPTLHQGCSKSCHSPTLHLEQPPHGEGTEAARTLWATLLHSLVPSSPLQHPPPIANCSNFQELSQSKGHMFFPALSSPFFADRWSNEAHEIYLSSRHSCRHSLLKQREVASGIQRQSLKGHYITCTIAATKLSHLYQKEATLSKHQ